MFLYFEEKIIKFIKYINSNFFKFFHLLKDFLLILAFKRKIFIFLYFKTLNISGQISDSTKKTAVGFQ